MAVLGAITILESELWPQRDARDPLGIFGWRGTQAGDASGGSNKVVIQVPAGQRSAYLFKIFDMVIAQIVGTPTAVTAKMRILANWPNIDADPGIQAYAALYMGLTGGSASLTAPNQTFIGQNPFNGNSKDILIYDPSTQTGTLDIAEQEVVNGDNVTWSFEGYGYYWDRAVMAAPGGPRNPGTS